MKMFKLCAVAAALAASALSASAMTSISDDQLSQVSGQDGVSIVADLNINIGSFTYTDKDGTGATGTGTTGASVSFNNIGISGMLIMTVDVLGGAQFATAATQSVLAHNATLAPTAAQAVVGAAAIATGYSATGTPAGDVVQFAFPTVGTGQTTLDARSVSPSITVDSIKTGNGGASFGSFALTNMDLQGTKIWMYGH